jgi:radical SAM protein with 4Fe4S-binding SPASM domain
MQKATIKDTIQIVKHLSWRRFWNLVALRFSFLLSRILKKPVVFGKPFALNIEPTTACNLGCPECPSGLKIFTRKTGKIDLEKHAKWIQSLKKSVFYVNYYFQGEPFLHPQFLDLIRTAKKNKIYTSTSTNAHFIDEEKAKEIIESGLDRLIISLDGTTQETYESYRINGSIETVKEATKILVETKKKVKSQTPHLIFQFLVVAPNEHQIEEAKALAQELGVDEIRFKTAQVYSYENGNPLIPQNEKYARYVKNADGTYRFKFIVKNKCWRMWSSAVLTWNGKVVPCSFDKDAQYQMGDINEADFKAIWKSEKYIDFRAQILKNRSEMEMCKNCSEGATVYT